MQHKVGPDPKKVAQRDHLLDALFPELFQTERSAERHGRREAARLGDSAPGAALRAIVAHAERVNAELPRLAEREDVPRATRTVRLLGAAFSLARTTVIDRLIEHERSYRGTLLGLRHGVDLVRMIRHVADAAGRVEIAGFCTRWLEEREPLVARVEQAMTWFAHHPAAATRKARRQVAPAT